MLLNCIVVKEENSFSSLCLDVDVTSEGETLIDAKTNLIEAVSLYIDSAIESHLPIIRTIPESENPAIISPEIIVDKFNIKVNVDVEEYA